jgi:hypothetical protein
LKKSVLLLKSILYLFVLNGCNKPSELVQKTIPVVSFTHLELYDKIEIHLVEDTTNFITIKCKEKWQKQVEIVQQNNTLVLHRKAPPYFLRNLSDSIVAEIHFTELKHIKNLSAANISNENYISPKQLTIENWYATGSINLKINTANLELKYHTGMAKINCYGIVENLYIYATEIGKINCVELNSNNCIVENKAITEIYIQAQKKIFSNIQGNGNVYYKGSASIIQNVSLKKGKLIAL